VSGVSELLEKPCGKSATNHSQHMITVDPIRIQQSFMMFHQAAVSNPLGYIFIS